MKGTSANMMSSSLSNAFITLAVMLGVFKMVNAAEFIFGGEAKRVCQAYKLNCPANKVCALQSLEWPRAMKFPVCVHERHVAVKSNLCRKPPMPGKCGAQFTRWYFNVHMGTCSWFTYGGCGGNKNNFRTAEECEQRCMDLDPAEAAKRRRNRERDRINNMIYVEEGRTDRNGNSVDDKAPTFITAPARAAEIIDLDNDVRASLQVNANENNATEAWKAEKRRRRKERRRRRRQRNKRRRKNRHNETYYTPARVDSVSSRSPPRQLTVAELGPFYGLPNKDQQSPNYQEVKGRDSSISHHRNSPGHDQHLWFMDTRFRRRRRRRNRRRGNTQRTNDQPAPHSSYSGAKQDSYYDKVKLFDILKNQEEKKENKIL